MVAFVNIHLMVICDPEDFEHSIAVGEYLTHKIESQVGYVTSGASSWIEKLFEEE